MSAEDTWPLEASAASTQRILAIAEGDADDVFSREWPLPPSPGSNSTDRWARLNGMLIPGGAGNVSVLARELLLRAVKANDEGEYWPVWGTCLGFEWIVQVFGGDGALQSGFDAVDEHMDIDLTQVSERKRMLAFANASVLRWLTHDNVTYEDHVSGIEPGRFMQSPGLTAEFEILADSRDRKGRPYVAMIQGKRLPFYAVQFHPEKIRYVENGRYAHNIPKTGEARCVADDLAEFFASELQRGVAARSSRESTVVV